MRSLALAASSLAGATGAATPLALDAAAASIPHPAKAATGGEDAHFLLDSAYGVFDGVGGWAESGHDPGLFSRALASHTARAISRQLADAATDAPVDLVRALSAGLAEVREIGTTTACLVHVDGAGALHALNVGDSGFRLLRPREGALATVASSTEQTHYFNCPFQLGTGSRDSPTDGETMSARVEAGDLIILATDGLIDNLSESDIARCVSKPLAAGSSAKVIADALASTALAASLDPKRNGPFAKSALELGYDFGGGKSDDITVVCVRVLCHGGNEEPRSKL